MTATTKVQDSPGFWLGSGARPADLSAPAQSLSLEADGLLLAQNEVCPGCELHYSLPAETRSITLRDEAGVPRAHLLTSQLNTHVFDQGRLSLTLTLDAASGQWSLCVIDLS